jgi:hypothetical protein
MGVGVDMVRLRGAGVGGVVATAGVYIWRCACEVGRRGEVMLM